MLTTSSYMVLDWYHHVTAPLRACLEVSSAFNKAAAKLFPGTPVEKVHHFYSAVFETTARHLTRFERPAFNIPETTIHGEVFDVREDVVDETAFCRLIHFKRTHQGQEKIDRNDPPVLLVAPMSGHYATLLRNTVEELLPNHEVFITDWKNARDIPVSEGKFDLSDYSTHIRRFLEGFGQRINVIAVCQPTVPVLATVALMAADKNPYRPLTMTLMSGPIHPSAALTDPVKLAKANSISFFERLTGEVSLFSAGATRRVYPGYMQLMAFMAMNPARHMKSNRDFFNHLTEGDEESASRHREFYNEYLATMDMTAEFYLETIEKVFIHESLAHGRLVLDNRIVDPSAIKDVALFTIECGKDDISAPGQTAAAHRLCSNLPDGLRHHYLQEGAGHYGGFSGSKWAAEICPRVTNFIRSVSLRHYLMYDAPTIDSNKIAERFITEKTVYLQEVIDLSSKVLLFRTPH